MVFKNSSCSNRLQIGKITSDGGGVAVMRQWLPSSQAGQLRRMGVGDGGACCSRAAAPVVCGGVCGSHAGGGKTLGSSAVSSGLRMRRGRWLWLLIGERNTMVT
ncbi:hypothetical protein Rs2_28864 [Raphanus sativus]|nr:hypothetical protein Rs2_28864 [Raphanus sativus]